MCARRIEAWHARTPPNLKEAIKAAFASDFGDATPEQRELIAAWAWGRVWARPANDLVATLAAYQRAVRNGTVPPLKEPYGYPVTTPELRAEVHRRRTDGDTYKRISKSMGISVRRVTAILKVPAE